MTSAPADPREEFEVLLADGGWRFAGTHPAGTHHIIESVRA
jgi:hypothetical protein